MRPRLIDRYAAVDRMDVVRRYHDGEPVKQIAASLGITELEVWRIVIRFGQERRP